MSNVSPESAIRRRPDSASLPLPNLLCPPAWPPAAAVTLSARRIGGSGSAGGNDGETNPSEPNKAKPIKIKHLTSIGRKANPRMLSSLFSLVCNRKRADFCETYVSRSMRTYSAGTNLSWHTSPGLQGGPKSCAKGLPSKPRCIRLQRSYASTFQISLAPRPAGDIRTLPRNTAIEAGIGQITNELSGWVPLSGLQPGRRAASGTR